MSAAHWRLLLVVDELQLVRALTPALIAAGYDVVAAENGETAMAALAGEGFDVVILDLGLPDMDGKEVISSIREWSEAPILVLSARDLEQEKIEALDLGADDYVNKPVGAGELLARLRAALRGRDRRFSAKSSFRAGPLSIDFVARRVWLAEREVRLPRREYVLLRTLARHAGMVVTHKQIITAVWGPGSQVDAQFVRVIVGQLRQKLTQTGTAARLLRTEPGVGYRLIAEDDD